MSNQTIQVLDVRNIPESMRITCVTLQGLVNRKKPKLYLLWSRWSSGAHANYRPESELHWLQVYKREYGLSFKLISPSDSISSVRTFSEFDRAQACALDVISKFASEVDGYIIYDPQLRDTINVATTMAGIENAIVTSPVHIETLNGFGLREIEDLRGRWENKIDAYRWAFNNLWQKCNHKLLASMEVAAPHLPFNCHHVRDYLVAHKVFTYDLSNNPRDKEEVALIDEIQSAAEPLSVVLGWRTSKDSPTYYVARNAMHGHTTLCCLSSPNLSFHSHIKAKTKVFKQKHKHIDPSQVTVEPKVYVTFLLSDGDAMHMMLSFQNDRWNDPNRGKALFAWGIEPLTLDFAPAVLEYYYKTLTENDYLVAALGLGYTYVGKMPKEIVGNYYDLLKNYMDKLDLKVLWAIDRDPFHSPPLNTPGHLKEVMTEHESKLREFILGVLAGFAQPPETPIIWAGDIPIVVCKLSSRTIYQTYRDIQKLADTFKERPLFLFVIVSCNDSGVSEVKAVTELLNPAKYKVVLPDEFLIAVALSRKAYQKT